MNERIQKLAEQAGVTPMVRRSDGLYVVGADVFEKFAELIIQECASMARVFHSHEYDFTGDLELDKFMLKHFGVEE